MWLAWLALLLPGFARAQALEALIAEALSSHPAVASQRAQNRAAQAALEGAQYQWYPTPSLSAEQAISRGDDPAFAGDKRVFTLRLQQPLWNGGRIRAGIDKAQAGVGANRAGLEDTRQQIALRVLQAYGDWLAAHLKTQANEKTLATYERLYAQVVRRFELGGAPQGDITLVQSRLQTTKAELANLRAQMHTAAARLSQLTGKTISGDGAFVPAAPRPWNGSATELTERAIARNGAVLKARAQVRAQQAHIDERRADLFPEVFARLEHQHGNHSFPNTGTENRIFIGVESRFGAGLSAFSGINDAVAQHAVALADAQAASRAVSEQVYADHSLAVSFEPRLAALRASQEAAVQVSESFDRQFLAGRKTWLDVMNAARELAQGEIQLADLRAAQVLTTWRLAVYTQGVDVLIGGNSSGGK